MKKLDNITLTSIAAEKAGMSYGKYVALYGVVAEEKEKPKPKGLPWVCPVCGKEFSDRKGGAVYCSEQCQKRRNSGAYIRRYRQDGAKEREKRVCVVCGKPIPETRSPLAMTCSYECGAELERRNKRIREKNRIRNKNKKMEEENA